MPTTYMKIDGKNQLTLRETRALLRALHSITHNTKQMLRLFTLTDGKACMNGFDKLTSAYKKIREDHRKNPWREVING